MADPHELVNLAESADHTETLVRLRGALEAWQTNVADLATEPEALMAERMWPGGKSPVTARPSTTRIGDELRITCTSEGASIGYRINDDDAWQLYTNPIHITKSVTRIDAKAVRYGWAESDAIRVDF